MNQKIEVLIQGILNGNKKAEEELYAKYKRKINHYLLSKYKYTNDHMDNVSDIMVKIFETLSKFNPQKSNFDTWVINIARNYMIDKSRKKQPIYVNFNSAFLDNDDNGEIMLTSSLNITEPESSYHQPDTLLEMSDTLTFASTQVSGASFSMLKMKYYEGYSYSDIGKEFSMNSKEVSSKLNYSKTKIKKGGK